MNLLKYSNYLKLYFIKEQNFKKNIVQSRKLKSSLQKFLKMPYQILKSDNISESNLKIAKFLLLVTFAYLCYSLNGTSICIIISTFIISSLCQLFKLGLQFKFWNIMIVSLISIFIGIFYFFNQQEGILFVISSIIFLSASFYLAKANYLQIQNQRSIKVNSKKTN